MKAALKLLILTFLALVGIEVSTYYGFPFHEKPLAVTELDDLNLPTPLAEPAKTAPPPPPPPREQSQPPPPPKPVRPRPTPAAPLLTPLAILPPPPPQPPPPPPADRDLYERLWPTVIQVFCSTPRELFSASGVIINERGLVLTNAHVADIVRKAGETNCQARHGNPADPFAAIEIVYAADTSRKIPATQVPQRDIAFLRLAEVLAPFKSAELAIAEVVTGASLLTLGYPSEFLQGVAASAHSNLVFSRLSVADTVDIDGDGSTAEGYVFHGGIVLQQGSSGTALFTPDGKVIGLIFATTKGTTTAQRDGIALMTPYIDRILRLETGQGMTEFIASH